MSAEQVTPFV